MNGRSRWNKIGLAISVAVLASSCGLYLSAERGFRAIAGTGRIVDTFVYTNQQAAAKSFAAISIIALMLLWRLGRPASR